MYIGLSKDELLRLMTTPVPSATATQLSNEGAVARAIAANNEEIARQFQEFIDKQNFVNQDIHLRLKNLEKAVQELQEKPRKD